VQRTNSIWNGALVILILCVLTTTGLVVRREFTPSARAPITTNVVVPNWSKFVAPDKWLGSREAPVTIVEFSDFQCPFCGKLASAERQLRAKYPTQVGINFRHFPLTSIHQYALPAALAAQCADEQGQFPAYHDQLFEHQQVLADSLWNALAKRSGITDLARFETCLKSPGTLARVNRDISVGDELGVNGTPTVLVGKQRLMGTPTFAQLDSAVQVALRR
jgi:protein-disulfide isomerase